MVCPLASGAIDAETILNVLYGKGFQILRRPKVSEVEYERDRPEEKEEEHEQDRPEEREAEEEELDDLMAPRITADQSWRWGYDWDFRRTVG